ncbi:hypothetical protein BD769DRAFT_1472301 [Suillus cothurnatus]|nr:hypothetical protein BD769DRAFT_1472301 [Suillus cothurnatus]
MTMGNGVRQALPSVRFIRLVQLSNRQSTFRSALNYGRLPSIKPIFASEANRIILSSFICVLANLGLRAILSRNDWLTLACRVISVALGMIWCPALVCTYVDHFVALITLLSNDHLTPNNSILALGRTRPAKFLKRTNPQV